MTPQVARASVEETSRQANLATFAIGTVGALEALGCVYNDLDVPGILCELLCYAAWVVAAALFCRWLYRAYGDVALLHGSPLRFTPGQAVASFFLPLVGLYRPYQVLVNLHEASDPRAMLGTLDTSNHGRFGERESRDGGPTSAWEKLFPARSWWALWLVAPWVTGILDNVSVLKRFTTLDTLTDPSAILLSQESAGDGLMRVLAASIHLALATLAIAVIRSVVARQRERLRRLECAAVEPPQ